MMPLVLQGVVGVSRRASLLRRHFSLRHHEPYFDGWSWQQELQSGLGASASLAGRIGREMRGMEGVLLALVVVFAVYP